MDKSRMDFLRPVARSNLATKFEDRRRWRFLFTLYPNLSARRRKTAGRAAAKLISAARKDGPESSKWFELVREHRVAFAQANPDLLAKCDAAAYKLTTGAWKHTTWCGSDWFNPPGWHFVHVSIEDAAQVAYYPSVRHLLEGREVRTRPGRYLQKYFADVLSEEDIRRYANLHTAASAPPQLHFVENTDPDGWEWVYEHGHGFCSCMVYDRSGRYLAEGLYGVDHPVRAYARRGNGLRLAWVGYGFKTDDGRVTARAIVRDDEGGNPKGYIRIFGDDSALFSLLEKAGYGQTASLYGVELNRRENGDGRVICPYLDSVGSAEDRGDYLLVSGDGVSSDSDGLLGAGPEYCCDDCGDAYDEDDLTWVGRDESARVCSCCLSRHYTYVHGRGGNEYYLHDDDGVVYCESDCEYYDSGYLDRYDIEYCSECGTYHHEDDMFSTQDGCFCVDCVTRLDIPDSDGNEYAVDKRTTADPDGNVIYEPESLSDAITHDEWHVSCVMEFKQDFTYWWAHPSTIASHPERFFVSVVDGDAHLQIVTGETPMPPVTTQCSFGIGEFDNVTYGDRLTDYEFDIVELAVEQVAAVISTGEDIATTTVAAPVVSMQHAYTSTVERVAA